MNQLSLKMVTGICCALVFSCFSQTVKSQTAAELEAQLRHARSLEFTRSTVPLKSGGTLTSIQSQGQTRVFLSQQDRTADLRKDLSARSAQAAAANPRPSNNSSPSNGSTRVFRQSDSGAQQNSGAYPYPAAGRAPVGGSTSRFAQDRAAAVRFEPAGLENRPTGALGGTGGIDQQAPPAASGSSVRVAQSGGGSGTRGALPPGVPAFQGPPAGGPNYVNPAANLNGFQGFQPGSVAANSVPALNVQRPNPGIGFQNPGAALPNCGDPRFTNPGVQFQPGVGTPQFNTNRDPFTGATAYTPLFNFRGLPAGSYLGQGIIGQPTAYVSGQPWRNLLRYLSP